MVKKLTERYENLKKHKNREGKERQNREKFLDDMQHTLWFVNKKTEKDLKTPTNSKKAEDWVYLEAIPGKNRKATFGSLNNKEQRKLKRNIKRQDQAMKRKLNLDTSFQRDFLRYISSEERAENMDQTFIPELTAKPKKKKTKKKLVFTPEVCSLAAKYSMSNRQVFKMVGAVTDENSLDDNILSVNTVRRKRINFFTEAERKLLANEFASASNFFTLHWDGIIFKA